MHMKKSIRKYLVAALCVIMLLSVVSVLAAAPTGSSGLPGYVYVPGHGYVYAYDYVPGYGYVYGYDYVPGYGYYYGYGYPVINPYTGNPYINGDTPVDDHPGIGSGIQRYRDVKISDWFFGYVDYVTVRGYMEGVGTEMFAPAENTTRAMMTTILWRIAGSPIVNYKPNFTDVKKGDWYYDAVCWATSKGIIEGYENGAFGVNDPLTRELYATMLYRYSVGNGVPFDFELNFTDADKVSDWAQDGVHWCVAKRILEGNGDGTLNPGGYLTRAQAAAIIYKFLTR